MNYQKSKLWKQSEITSNFARTHYSFSNEKRFKLHSIYWPESQSIANVKLTKHKTDKQEIADKLSKIIDQQEKNQQRANKNLLLNKIKTQTSKPTNPIMSLRQTSNSFIVKQNNQNFKKLSLHSHKQQYILRDKYGFRNPIVRQDPQHEQLKLNSENHKKFINPSTRFNSARRVDLNLPENYYPGPGFYKIKRYLEDKDKKLSKVKFNSLKKRQ